MIARTFTIFLCLLLLPLSGCKKVELAISGRQGITIFLLSDHKTVDNSWAISSSGIKLERTALLDYEDILTYDPATHTFTLSEAGADAVAALPNDGHQRAFAVLANGELIYTAYFWAGFSSTSCDWVVADPLFAKSLRQMSMRLGYAAITTGNSIPDKRNDARILSILAADNKLI